VNPRARKINKIKSIPKRPAVLAPWVHPPNRASEKRHPASKISKIRDRPRASEHLPRKCRDRAAAKRPLHSIMDNVGKRIGG
jgi:hypothetical protein